MTSNPASSVSSEATPQPILYIEGGRKLSGHVEVSGAKNSALALMAGALLSPEPCRLRNVPRLVDIQRMGEILTTMGVKVSHTDQVLDIDASSLSSCQAPYELVSQLRASFFAIGSMLVRCGVAKIPLPGGCAIGTRPVDLHVRGLQQLGATVQIDGGMVNARARKLVGARIHLDYPSVGATETLMMAAVGAEGETILENAAQEPEVEDLADFLRSMGATIRGAGTNTITIVGPTPLHGTEYTVMPDRIEAGTLLIAAAATSSTITIGPVVPEHLSATTAKLEEMGLHIQEVSSDRLQISPGQYRRAVDVETLPYPGFPTDMQAQMMVLAALSEGDCAISETVFENRLNHVPELNRMGADIRIRKGVAIVRGVPALSGAPVASTDLRAAAALVIAGLAGQGVTAVQNLKHLDRGYEDLEGKLRQLGARLERSTNGCPFDGSVTEPIPAH
ncbi:MAG: UDP-N-acetylglucosamine 1-carboxyvinyltransferase [Synechococcus sp.]